MKKRNESVDMLRGICMLCVLMGHVGGVPDVVMKWLYPFYVPAFFFITGYLKHSFPQKGCEKHILERWKRLIIPYFAYNIFLLLCCMMIHHLGKNEIVFAIKGILYSRFCLYPEVQDAENIYFFTVSNSPLWFLTALFVSEVFFYSVFYGARSRAEFILRVTGLLLLGFYMDQLSVLLPWSIDTALIGAVLVAMGYCWKLNEQKFSLKWIYVLLFLVYVVVASINVNANMSVRYYGPYSASVFLFAAGGVAGTVLIKHMCDIIHENRMNFILTDILCRIGRNSMPILALHWFLFSICDIFIDRLGITVLWPLGYSILKIIIVVVACIGVARCLHFREKRLVK